MVLGKHPTTGDRGSGFQLLCPYLMFKLTSLLLDTGGLREPPKVVGPSGAKMIQGLVLSFAVS